LKKSLYIIMVAVSVMLMIASFSLAGCKTTTATTAAAETTAAAQTTAAGKDSGIPGFTLAPWITEKIAAGDFTKLKIVAVYQNTSVNFFQLLKGGVDGAAKELKVDASATGPSTANVDEQVNIIEGLITNKVDGIVTDIINPEALNGVIDKAMAAGIPVVTFNSDANGSKRIAFYGQDLKNSGVVCAQALIEFMGDKGDVMLVSGDLAATWSQGRMEGNKEVLSKLPGIKVVLDLNAGQGGFDEAQVYADIENAFKANPTVKGVSSMDAVTTPAVGRYILRNKLVGKVFHTGQDWLPETLDNIDKGATQVSLSQDPYGQGFKAVKGIYDYLTKGIVPVNTDTGVARGDSKNVKDLLAKLAKGEPIG
jgi:ABC-type sugar transport system substrate-binding protein